MTTETAEELKKQGNSAFSAGDYDRAIALFTQAIGQDESNHVLYSNRSAAYCGKKMYAEALTDADKVVALKPDWSKGLGRKGAALFGLGRLEEAEKAYADGLKIEPESAALKKGLEEVRSSTDLGAPPGGMPQIFGPDVLAQIAGNAKLCAYLADPTYVAAVQAIQANPNALGQYLQDKRIMETFASLMGIDMRMADDKDMSKMEEMGEARADAQEQAAAKAAAEEAKAKEQAAANAAAAAEAAAQEEELSAEEKEAAERKEASKQAKEQGNQSYKAKQFDEALQHYSHAWELDQNDVTVMTNKAAVYFEQGDYDNCIKTCEEAVERGREIRADFKHIARALGRIGNAYFKQDNLPMAVKYYQKSLSEHRTPEILGKLRETEKLQELAERKAYHNPELAEEARNKGNEMFKKGSFADAIPHYNEAIKRDEADPRAYSNRAACYMKLMALPNALKDTETAISLDSKFVKAYIRKAAVQFAMKEYAKSMATCDEALLIDAEHHAGKHRAELEQQKGKATMAMYGMAGAEEGGESMEERQKRAMSDPKVQEIMNDPTMRMILQQMSTDPMAVQEHMKNPFVREKIMLLANAGIIQLR